MRSSSSSSSSSSPPSSSSLSLLATAAAVIVVTVLTSAPMARAEPSGLRLPRCFDVAPGCSTTSFDSFLSGTSSTCTSEFCTSSTSTVCNYLNACNVSAVASPELLDLSAIDERQCLLAFLDASPSMPALPTFGTLAGSDERVMRELRQLVFEHHTLDDATLPSTLFTAAHFPALAQLDLACNGLVGVAPPSLATLGDTLAVSLNLHYNRLSGTLPAEWSALTRLRSLWLHNNRLSGSLPAEWGALSSLEVLTAAENRLDGSLPAALFAGATALQQLSLQGNSFTGTLPTTIGRLTALQYLDLSGNNLSGELPSELGLLTSLRHLNLRNNAFDGTVPAEVLALPELRSLRITKNEFSALAADADGIVRIGPRLRSVRASTNALVQPAPAFVVTPGDGETSLRTVRLKNNALYGTLPELLRDGNPLMRLLSMKNNELSGIVNLTEWRVCCMPELEKFKVRNNDDLKIRR